MQRTLHHPNSYTSNTGFNRLYPIVIHIRNTHGGWTPVQCISDTGNEISIFKREVADSLGLNLSQGERFNVAGITGSGNEYRRFKLQVKIGNLQPIVATIGFAVNHGQLVENLLGNADILKSGKFQVTYDGNSVTYTQKALSARVATCSKHDSEQTILNNLYDHMTTRKKRYEKCDYKKPDESWKKDNHHNSISGYGVFY